MQHKQKNLQQILEKKLAKDVFLCNIVKPVSQYGNEKDYHIIWRFCITDES